jgi:hypothetical protein
MRIIDPDRVIEGRNLMEPLAVSRDLIEEALRCAADEINIDAARFAPERSDVANIR